MTKEWLDDRVRNFDFGDTHRPRWEVLGRSGGIPFPEIIWNWELRKCVFQRLLFTFWTFNSAHFGNKKISSRWWKQHFLIHSTIIRDTYLVLYSKEDFKSPSSTRFQSFFCASRSSTKEPDYTDYLVIQNGDKYVRGGGLPASYPHLRGPCDWFSQIQPSFRCSSSGFNFHCTTQSRYKT